MLDGGSPVHSRGSEQLKLQITGKLCICLGICFGQVQTTEDPAKEVMNFMFIDRETIVSMLKQMNIKYLKTYIVNNPTQRMPQHWPTRLTH